MRATTLRRQRSVTAGDIARPKRGVRICCAGRRRRCAHSKTHSFSAQVELLVDMVTLANLDCDKLSDELEQKEKELGIG